MSIVGLWIDPLDPLLFRDGRPFEAASQATSDLPTPRTLAGALRTALLASSPAFDGARFVANARVGDGSNTSIRGALLTAGAPDWIVNTRFRGPWLALDTDPIEPLLPVPANLVREDKAGQCQWARSEPRPNVPGWNDAPRLPLWRTSLQSAKYPGGYLRLQGIHKFLQGQLPDETDYFRTDQLYALDARVGIGVDADTHTTTDGRLYTVRYLALQSKVTVAGCKKPARVGFYAEVVLPDGADVGALHAALASL
jgi:CRISPR-associated protein Cmr3